MESKIELPRIVLGCKEFISNQMILVGEEFVKIVSTNGKIVDSIETSDLNSKCELCPDKNKLFVANESGLLIFELPNLKHVKTVLPGVKVSSLVILLNTDKLLFNSGSELHLLDILSLEVSSLPKVHDSEVNSLAIMKSEPSFFSSDSDRHLFKWNTSSWSVEKSSILPYECTFLYLSEKYETFYVGLIQGSLLELNTNDLSTIRSCKVHSDGISSISQPLKDLIVTSSLDGYVAFPYSNIEPIKMTSSSINEMIILNNKTIVCACFDEGIISKRLPEPSDIVIDQLIKSLESIKLEQANRKPKYIQAITNHFKTLTNTDLSFDFFKGTLIENVPKGVSSIVYDSNIYIGNNNRNHTLDSQKTKIITPDYFANIIRDPSTKDKKGMSLTLFKQKLNLKGTIPINHSDILSDFQISILQKGKLCWILDKARSINDLNCSARMIFSNGELNCFITKGDIVFDQNHPVNLSVDGDTKNIQFVSKDYVFVDHHLKSWKLDFSNNIILSET